jgi:hypothetical protein
MIIALKRSLALHDRETVSVYAFERLVAVREQAIAFASNQGDPLHRIKL